MARRPRGQVVDVGDVERAGRWLQLVRLALHPTAPESEPWVPERLELRRQVLGLITEDRNADVLPTVTVDEVRRMLVAANCDRVLELTDAWLAREATPA